MIIISLKNYIIRSEWTGVCIVIDRLGSNSKGVGRAGETILERCIENKNKFYFLFILFILLL